MNIFICFDQFIVIIYSRKLVNIINIQNFQIQIIIKLEFSDKNNQTQTIYRSIDIH